MSSEVPRQYILVILGRPIDEDVKVNVGLADLEIFLRYNYAKLCDIQNEAKEKSCTSSEMPSCDKDYDYVTPYIRHELNA